MSNKPTIPGRPKRGTAQGHTSGSLPAQREEPTDPSDEQQTNIYDSTNRRAKVSAGAVATDAKDVRSGPIQVISMKTPGIGGGPAPIERPRPQVKLRAIAEVSTEDARPANLGYLAPPRDPAETRARRLRDYVVWGSLAVILASAVAVGIWFLGR
jgi:hypothetical protein